MAEYMFSPAAFGKVYLHAHIHPSQAVSGFLIGTRTSASGASVLFVEDTFPLFHTYLQLAPMLDLGFELATATAEKRGLSVVGYYVAPATLTERPVITAHTEKIVNMINGKSKGKSLAVVLLNDKMTASVDEVPFKMFDGTDLRTGKTAESGCYASGYLFEGNVPTPLPDATAANERLRSLIQAGNTALADFEDHLEAPEKDYQNPKLTEALSSGIVPAQK